jgi:urea transport system ATP-binding protein
VWENLELALKANRSPFAALRWQADTQDRAKIEDTLALINLADQKAAQAANLSHGQKQWLEIGMLLMQEPELLLVDEPVAGMTDAETEKTATLLKNIAGEKSVVVVEHDMDFIQALGVRVTVLHEGSVLAEGALEAVQKNQRVIEVYLGR